MQALLPAANTTERFEVNLPPSGSETAHFLSSVTLFALTQRKTHVWLRIIKLTEKGPMSPAEFNRSQEFGFLSVFGWKGGGETQPRFYEALIDCLAGSQVVLLWPSWAILGHTQ